MTNQISTQVISFHGSELVTLKVEDVIYTAVKPIVKAMGLDWGGQQQKLAKSGNKFGCRDISMPTNGGMQSMLCMPLKKLNGWLFSINPEKVRADLREKVIQYQEECFEALYNYWHFGKAERKTTVDQRTGLRNAVNMLVSKKGLIYSEAYHLIHQRFNVESIEDLTLEQLPQAVEYVHKIILEGELITEAELPSREKKFSFEFTEFELEQLVWLWCGHKQMNTLLGDMIKPLETIGSYFTGMVISHHQEYQRQYKNTLPTIQRLIQPFKASNRMNWERAKNLIAQ